MTIWDKISELWWQGNSPTHHNRELPDLAQMKRRLKWLRDPHNRNPDRDAMADELQQLIDREEKEAKAAEENWR